MTPKLLHKYQDKGITTITQLSYLFKPRRRRKHAGKSKSFNFELQALALRTGKIYLDQAPPLPKRPIELFLDIEGVPDRRFKLSYRSDRDVWSTCRTALLLGGLAQRGTTHF
jgi:predicted RecB family nuclease